MDSLVTGFYLLLGLAALAAGPAWIFRRLLPRATAAGTPRARILLKASGVLLIALPAPVALLLLLVGIEELAGTALVPERIALFTLALTALHLATAFLALVGLAVRLRGKPPA